ncbi:reverse transcriptase [Phytophthora megakarya]|uniref:Reverse transcriptase n=1 Tax=Phytophthora megakarya TaxID=4795 RepID=A0A225WE49_9STRA|nr:reverse transcriptase [Phytophthora megakarya]
MEVTDVEVEATVFFHEGSELLSDLKDQLAALPELKDLSPIADLDNANIGEPDETTQEMDTKVRAISEKHHSILVGDGNAVPTPARRVVCDLDVNGTKPIAQRSKQVPHHHLQKVYDLLKKLLETKLIEYSDSEWASPIVIVMKNNGVDIRLCIDY